MEKQIQVILEELESMRYEIPPRQQEKLDRIKLYVRRLAAQLECNLETGHDHETN